MNKENSGADRLPISPLELAKSLGHPDLKSVNGRWMDMILTGKKDMTLQAHRNSYKSTCLSVCVALMLVTEGDKNILLIRKTASLVRETVRNVKVILESEVFRALCREKYGKEPEITRQNSMSLTTCFYFAPKGAEQLQGIGLGTGMTGMHADIIITDDIVTQKDRFSEAERERTARIYQELQNIRSRKGRIINIGTPWHREDCFRLMPEARKYDCYHTGILTGRELERIRRSMVPSLFAANYELRLIADEDAPFTGDIRCYSGTRLPPGGIAHIDAAYGGRDFTALTLLSSENRVPVLLGRLYKKSVLDCLDSILSLCEEQGAAMVFCEVNGDKGFLAREIRLRGCPVRGYHESRNKEMKISACLGRWWKTLLFLPGTDEAYLRQIRDWRPGAAHDDAPDSAASALLIWSSRAG